jgi:hypothetical protein
MNIAIRWHIPLLCLILTFNIFSGCLYLPQNTLPKVGDLPPLAKGTEKLALTYAFSSNYLYLDSENQQQLAESSEGTTQKYESKFMKVVDESGYFASIKTSGDWDIDIEAQFTYETDQFMRMLGVLSFLTLTILPAYMPESYHITAIVTAQDETKHTYTIDENGLATVTWLPLIFVKGDCRQPYRTRSEILENMWKTLLLKMQYDGIIFNKK